MNTLLAASVTMASRRLFRFVLPGVLVGALLTVAGCPGTPAVREDVDRSRMEALGLRLQKVRQAIADESAKEPAKVRAIAAKYAKALQYLDEEAARLPEGLREEFARKYRKK